MTPEPIGLHANRLKKNCDNPREVAFVEQWKQEYEWRDLLTDLLMVPCSEDDPQRIFSTASIGGGPRKQPLGLVVQRDRIVVETVIQWLGSGVGMSFLHEALKRVGYTVTKMKGKP